MWHHGHGRKAIDDKKKLDVYVFTICLLPTGRSQIVRAGPLSIDLSESSIGEDGDQSFSDIHHDNLFVLLLEHRKYGLVFSPPSPRFLCLHFFSFSLLFKSNINKLDRYWKKGQTITSSPSVCPRLRFSCSRAGMMHYNTPGQHTPIYYLQLLHQCF